MAGRRRGSAARSALVLLVVLLILGGLVVAADRVAAHVVEDQIGRRLQTQLGTAAPPVVDIAGFPFLTQALDGSLHSVRVQADALPATEEQPIPLAAVDLRLQDVTSGDVFETFTVTRVDGNATLDYATAQQLAGMPIRYAPDNRVELTVKTQVLSTPVTARVVGLPEIDVTDQTLTLREPEVTVAGVAVPRATAQSLLDNLLKPVPITGLPDGLRITGVSAQSDGLHATVTGQDMAFSR